MLPKFVMYSCIKVILFTSLTGCVCSCAAQDGDDSTRFASRFRKVQTLIDRRIEIGVVSSAVRTAWMRLESEAERRGKLLTPREFADFLIENQFELVGSDYGHIQSMYLSLQEPPKEWTAILESHVSHGNAVVPASYDSMYSYNRHPFTLHVQSFHDGQHCSTSATKYVDGEATLFAITAADGSRLMRFSRHGGRCDQAIEVPREEWNADITQSQGYHEAIRKDDPFLLYFPDTFRMCYGLEAAVPLVADVSSQIWESTGTKDGKNVFFCGSPMAYMAFDVDSGDLVAFATGEYALSDGGIRPGTAGQQNRVLFASHKPFEKLGRLPAKITVDVGGSFTIVQLLNANQASPASDQIIEQAIPVNAYVLDRIRNLKYIKPGEM